MHFLPDTIEKHLCDTDALLASLPGDAVGYVGFDIPEDILAATGRPTFHLPWRKAVNTPFADKWLETSFPAYARSILEDWKAGAFDRFDRVVFSRGDDVAQRLWYYICELQRREQIKGPKPFIYDAARVQRSTSHVHAVGAVQRLCGQLDISDTALLAGVELANKRRKLLSGFNAPGLCGLAKDQIARASLLPGLEEWLDSIGAPKAGGDRRIVIGGSNLPDSGMHAAIRSAGWNVAASLNDISVTRLGQEIELGDQDVWTAVGVASNALKIGPRAFNPSSGAITNAISATGSKAAVYWVIEEDEARAWHVPAVRKVLENSGLPHLVMTRRSWRLDDGALEDVSEFLEGLS